MNNRCVLFMIMGLLCSGPAQPAESGPSDAQAAQAADSTQIPGVMETNPTLFPDDHTFQVADSLDQEPGFPVKTDEIKFFGDYVIDRGETNRDKVRIIGGDLTVYGHLSGQFTIIGGDTYIKPGAVVEGRIIAVGGKVHKDPQARITGKIIEANLGQGLSYKETYDADKSEIGESDLELKQRSRYARRSWIHLPTAWFIYNRQEGLLLTPFNFTWDRESLSNLRLSLTAGWRFGHQTPAGRITLEGLLLGRHLILFGSAFRESRTDDYYRLPETENTLAGLLARQDFYDRWNETGLEAGAGLDLNWIKIKASLVTFEQDSIPVNRRTWSLLHQDRSLRLAAPDQAVIPDRAEGYRLVLAFKPLNFNPLSSGLALYLNGEITTPESQAESYYRLLGIGILSLEITPGVLVRTRILAGSGSDSLPAFRRFGAGGLGSVSAHPYKQQRGNQAVQLNTELVFAPEFIGSDLAVILFSDFGHAWNQPETGYLFTDFEEISRQGMASIGLGLADAEADGDVDWRINVARPLDGSGRLETTIRINFNF